MGFSAMEPIRDDESNEGNEAKGKGQVQGVKETLRLGLPRSHHLFPPSYRLVIKYVKACPSDVDRFDRATPIITK